MYPSRAVRIVHHLLRVLAALAGAALLSAIGLGIANALSVTLPIGPVTATVTVTGTPLDKLGYTIRTRYATTGACGGERTASSVIGLPTPVDVGGTSLPDVLVTLVAVPGSVAGAPDVVELAVTKLNAGAPLKALVEVVIAPSTSGPGRVALGYDACESGAPSTYNSVVTATPSRITLRNTTGTPQGSLTVLGSMYDAVGSTRANPTAVTARLAPVPRTLSADIDILPESAYHALVKTNAPTDLHLTLDDSTGPKYTKVDATVESFPGQLDVTFNPSVIGYTASAPINHLKVDVESYEPAPAGSPTSSVSRINADLFGVPASSTITRSGNAHLAFSTPAPGKITSATVNYASFLPGQRPAALVPLGGEYLVADVGLDHLAAEVHLLDLASAEIDSGDLVVVDVKHRQSSFNADVKIASPAPATATNPVITRRLVAKVDKLPATARVTYRASSGAFTYTGSDTVEELNVDVSSSVPLIDKTNADHSHLRLVSVPTGLTGRLNADAKTFTATMDTGAAITTVEAQVTSGPDLRLPDGQDGILVSQETDRYVVFARISGLKAATVGWGDTLTADLTHKAGSFLVKADVADSNADGIFDDRITVDGRILDLPATARIDYTAGKKARLRSPEIPTTLVYDGSEVINQIAVNVVSQKPLVAVPGSQTDPDTLKMTVFGLPGGRTTVSSSAVGSSVTTTQGAIGKTEIELCSSTAGCRPPPVITDVISTTPEPDGIWLTNHGTGSAGHSPDYGMFARVHGLSSLTLGTGKTTSVVMTHTAGPFDVETRTEKFRALDGYHSPTGYYVESVDVAVRDLPATVALSYTPTENHLTYTGSNSAGAPVKIGSLVIEFSNGNIPVIGRAHDLKVDVAGLGSGVDLSYDFGDDGQSIVLDAGAGRIDRLKIDALSDPSLLTKASVASHLSLAKGFDGLMIWDLEDEFAPRVDPTTSNWYGDRVNDPYILLARVTNLQRFAYTVAPDKVTDDTINTDVELVRDGGGPSLYIEVRDTNGAKPAAVLDDFPNPFEYEGLYVTYIDPPARLGYKIKELRGNAGEHMYDITTTGSSRGGSVKFETDMGAAAMLGLDVTLEPVPAGTARDPGIHACVAPGYLGCVLPLYDVYVKGKGEDPFSMYADVKSPVDVIVHMDVMVVSGTWDTVKHQKIVADLLVDKWLAVSKSADTSGANSNIVYLDTANNAVSGNVHTFLNGSSDATVNLPLGTRADQRFVEIENSGVHNTRNTGYLMCPHGFLARSWFLGGRVSLNDDLCTSPVLTSVVPGPISPDGRLHTIDLYGVSFAPATSDDHGDWEGTHVTVDHGFSTTNWEWLSPNHIRVAVMVPPSAPAGDYLISLTANTDVVESIGNDPQAKPCTCYFHLD